MRKALLLVGALLVLLTAAQAATAADFSIKKDGVVQQSRTYTGTNAHGCFHFLNWSSWHTFNNDIHVRLSYTAAGKIADSWTNTPASPTRVTCYNFNWVPPVDNSYFRWKENTSTPFYSTFTNPTCVDVDVLGFISVQNLTGGHLYVEFNYAAGQPWGGPTSSVTASIHTDGACVN